MCPKDANGASDSVDTDQTAPFEGSGSVLFAWTCLSENLEPLLDSKSPKNWDN